LSSFYYLCHNIPKKQTSAQFTQEAITPSSTTHDLRAALSIALIFFLSARRSARRRFRRLASLTEDCTDMPLVAADSAVLARKRDRCNCSRQSSGHMTLTSCPSSLEMISRVLSVSKATT
jgi:hypothetical protein